MIEEVMGKFTVIKADPDAGERILLPEQWWDREMVSLVANWGLEIPVNRIYGVIYNNQTFRTGVIRWYPEQESPRESEYKLRDGLNKRKYGEGALSPESKRHKIFLLLIRDPLKLENIPQGNYAEIWGDYDDIDFTYLSQRGV
jgi:hypothetical protein